MAPVELLIAGGGSRGATFAGWAARHPERARVVAVAEPRADRREALADAHGVAAGAALRGLARGGRRRRAVADAAVVATLDREHTEPAIALAEQGYALLIEKPLATTEAECVAIAEATERAGRGRRRGARAALHALHAARAAPARRGRGRRGGQRRAPRAGRLLPPCALLRARQLAPRGRGRADAAGQVLPRPRLALPRGRAPGDAVSSFGSLSAAAARAPARGRRRPLPGLRDRAGLRVLRTQDLPRAGRAGRDGLARRRRRLAADARARRGGAARRALRPLRVGLRQRRRRPPGRLARLRGRRHREPDDDRLHADARPRDADLRHRAASCAATAPPSRSTTSSRAPRRATRSPAAAH